MVDDASLARPGAHCPSCSREVSGATPASSGAAGRRPVAGDVSICLYCGEVLVFTEDSLRPATAEEIVQLNKDPEFWHARNAVHEVIRGAPF